MFDTAGDDVTGLWLCFAKPAQRQVIRFRASGGEDYFVGPRID
jgi:hypothetical protein